VNGYWQAGRRGVFVMASPAASILDVARRADVDQGGFYHHFRVASPAQSWRFTTGFHRSWQIAERHRHHGKGFSTAQTLTEIIVGVPEHESSTERERLAFRSGYSSVGPTI